MSAPTATAAPPSGVPRLAFSYRRVSDLRQTKEGRAGLDRQADAFVNFCQKHGLTPNPDPLVDRGLSAFHGRHRKRGALGAFIAAAGAGRIPPGAVLVVEDLDRFSRETASHAEELLLALFKQELALGIVRDDVVVDRARYDADLGLRVMLLTRRDAAHDYSKKLSGRISDVWSRRQRDWQLHRKPYLGKVARPEWLTDNGTSFLEIPEAVDFVQKVFRLCAEGMGSTQIAERLNAEGFKPARSDAYGPARILRILHDRRVLGEKQWPDGTISPDYFPRIIDQEIWDTCQQAIDNRHDNKGRHGRGEIIANIFQGGTFCACGRALYLQPARSRQGTVTHGVLRCTGRRKHTCTQPPGDWKYDEEALLQAFMSQRWAAFFDRPAETQQQRTIRKQIRELEALEALQQKQADTAAETMKRLLAEGDLDATTAKMLGQAASEALESAEATRNRLRTTRAELQQLQLRPSGTEIQQQIKKQVKSFLLADRRDIQERRRFNNWFLSLGVRVTVLDSKLGRLQWGTVDAVLYRDKRGMVYSDESLGDMAVLGVSGAEQRLEDIKSEKDVVAQIRPKSRRVKPAAPPMELLRLEADLKEKKNKQDLARQLDPPSSPWPQPDKAWDHVDRNALERLSSRASN